MSTAVYFHFRAFSGCLLRVKLFFVNTDLASSFTVYGFTVYVNTNTHFEAVCQIDRRICSSRRLYNAHAWIDEFLLLIVVKWVFVVCSWRRCFFSFLYILNIVLLFMYWWQFVVSLFAINGQLARGRDINSLRVFWFFQRFYRRSFSFTKYALYTLFNISAVLFRT